MSTNRILPWEAPNYISRYAFTSSPHLVRIFGKNAYIAASLSAHPQLGGGVIQTGRPVCGVQAFDIGPFDDWRQVI